MKKIILLLVSCSLLTTSCTLSDKIADISKTLLTEATEGYENVKTEVEDKTSAAKEKIDKINQAAEDVGDAANAIGTAIDSVQAINEETGTGTTAE